MNERDPVVKWWLRLGAICFAASVIIGLAMLLFNLATAGLTKRLNSLDESVLRLSDTVELTAYALVEPDSTLKADALRLLRQRHFPPRQR